MAVSGTITQHSLTIVGLDKYVIVRIFAGFICDDIGSAGFSGVCVIKIHPLIEAAVTSQIYNLSNLSCRIY